MAKKEKKYYWWVTYDFPGGTGARCMSTSLNWFPIGMSTDWLSKDMGRKVVLKSWTKMSKAQYDEAEKNTEDENGNRDKGQDVSSTGQ